jgi:hypothetical protein
VWPLPCFKLCHRAACATLRPVPRCNRRPEPCCGRCHVAAGARTLLCGVETEVLAEAQSRLGFSSGNRTLHMQPVTVLSHDFAVLPGTARCTHSRSQCTVTNLFVFGNRKLHMQPVTMYSHDGEIGLEESSTDATITACATLRPVPLCKRKPVPLGRQLPKTVAENCFRGLCSKTVHATRGRGSVLLVHLGCRPGRTVSQHIELTCKASLSHMLEPTP